jgi:curved DNA-binding protein CbpA
VFGRKSHGEIPGSSEVLPGVGGKLVGYLLKGAFGMKEPGKGKDLEDDVYLSPQRALEGGKGRYVHRRRSKELIITIPPGIKEGQKIRLRGMGKEGNAGGEPGDLYLRVKFNKPLLQRLRDVLKI